MPVKPLGRVLTASKKNADTEYHHKHHSSKAVASPVHTVGIERLMMAHTLSMLKTNAVTRHSNKSAVGLPKGHHSHAVRSPTTQ